MEPDNKPDKDQHPDFYQARLFYFKFDPEQGYSHEQRKHPETDQNILNQLWDAYQERLEDAKNKVLSGEASVLLYHKERMKLELPDLSKMVGISKWRVKRHFKPHIYKKLNLSVRERYAKVFNLTVENLDKID
jgi:hypothetical protein